MERREARRRRHNDGEGGHGPPRRRHAEPLGVGRLVLSGQVTEQCILYSALDAHVRHFDVVIPTDAVAAIYDDLGEAALTMMGRNMSAELAKADEVGWRTG